MSWLRIASKHLPPGDAVNITQAWIFGYFGKRHLDESFYDERAGGSPVQDQRVDPGISRGFPLSNTNRLWGLLWGFGELHGLTRALYAQVIGGSTLMAAGAVAIAFSSATEGERFPLTSTRS